MKTQYGLESLLGSRIGKKVETGRFGFNLEGVGFDYKFEGGDLILVYPSVEPVPIKGFIVGKYDENLENYFSYHGYCIFNLEGENNMYRLKSDNFAIVQLTDYSHGEFDVIGEIEFGEISMEYKGVRSYKYSENTEKYIEFFVVGPSGYFRSIVGERNLPGKENDLRVAMSLGLEGYEVSFENRTYSHEWGTTEYEMINTISVTSKLDVDDEEFIQKSTEIVDLILLISSVCVRSKVQWFKYNFRHQTKNIRITGDFNRKLSINRFRERYEIKEFIEKSYKSIQSFRKKIDFEYIMSKIVDGDSSTHSHDKFISYYLGLERLVIGYAKYNECYPKDEDYLSIIKNHIRKEVKDDDKLNNILNSISEDDFYKRKKGLLNNPPTWNVFESLFNDLQWDWRRSCLGSNKPNFLNIRNKLTHGSSIKSNELRQEIQSTSFILLRILFYVFNIEDRHRYYQLTEDIFYSPIA